MRFLLAPPLTALLVCVCSLPLPGQSGPTVVFNQSVLHVGDRVGIRVEGLTMGRLGKILFAARDGSPIPAGPLAYGVTTTVLVPPGAVSGPVYADWIKPGPAADEVIGVHGQVKIYPRLRVRAGRVRLTPGESTTVKVVAKEDPEFPLAKLYWRADLGQVDAGGRFVAPPVNATQYARIWACLEPNIECATTVVEVSPVRLEPETPVLQRGQTVQLRAVRGGLELPGIWRAVTRNVSMTPEGRVTAGEGPLDGGVAMASVTTSTGEHTFEFYIRGNGAETHAAEYFDWTIYDRSLGALPEGVATRQVLASGEWVYAFAIKTPGMPSFEAPWGDSWIDVYRLDGSGGLGWVTAIEAPHPFRLGRFEIDGSHLIFTDDWSPRPGGGVIYVYDISAGVPALVSRTVMTEGEPTKASERGLRCSLDPARRDFPATLLWEDLDAGTKRKVLLEYQTPTGVYFSSRVLCFEHWAAIMFHHPGAGFYETIVVDTRESSARPLAVLPIGDLNFSMTWLNGTLLLGTKVFQIKEHALELVTELPVGHVLDVDRKRSRILAVADPLAPLEGFRVVDLSDRALPRVSAPVAAAFVPAAALAADFVVVADRGAMNLAIHPISWEAGPWLHHRLLANCPPYRAVAGCPVMHDVKARNGLSFWTGAGRLPSTIRSTSPDYFQIYDTASSALIATVDRPENESGWAIELVGDYAYVGTDKSLVVYDVRLPRAPAERTLVPRAAYSMARAGNFLYVGSNDDLQPLLLVYDIADPAQPRLLGSTPLPDFAYSMTAQRGWLAVALGERGLRFYSLNDPARPAVFREYSGVYWGVASAGSFLYAAAGRNGLNIFEVPSTGSTALIHSRQLSSTALAIAFDERGMVWICTKQQGRVYGLDVREPRQSRLITQFETALGEYAAENSIVADNLLFVVSADLAVFHVGSPQNVGLSYVRQPGIGEVRPDRLGQAPPYYGPQVKTTDAGEDHPKAKFLRQRNRKVWQGLGRAENQPN